MPPRVVSLARARGVARRARRPSPRATTIARRAARAGGAPRAAMRDSATSTRAHWASPEIRRFRRLDAETRASEASEPAVVFVGSSIFREWREVRDFEEDWRGRMGDARRAVNRAFGGAETTDLLTCVDDVLPRGRADVRAIVYYCGSNDVSVGRSAREVFENFKRFAESARRERSARLGVVFVGMIDSPQKRAFALSHVVRETNALCEAWCAKTPGAVYADVTETFADASSFREDGTHLRPEAYDGFRDAIARAVVEAVAHASPPPDDAFLPPAMRR